MSNINLTVTLSATPELTNLIQSLITILTSNTNQQQPQPVGNIENTQPAYQPEPQPVNQGFQQNQTMQQNATPGAVQQSLNYPNTTPQGTIPTQIPNETAIPTAQPQMANTGLPLQQPAGLPTAAPTYTLEQLQYAAMTLMDAGKQAALHNALSKLGVRALTELSPDLYGEFANELRQAGAQI